MGKKFNTNYLVKVAVLGVLSFLIMFIELPMPFTPEFLKVDLSDLPAIIGAFAMGPLAGAFIEFVKILLKLVIRGTNTAGVGEIANFLVGSIYAVTAAIIYRRRRNKKNLVIGLVMGTVVMSLVASVLNYSILLPFYSKAYGMPLSVYVDMAKAVNSFVVDLKTFIIYGIFPFNMIKGVIMAVISYPVYIRLRNSIEL